MVKSMRKLVLHHRLFLLLVILPILLWGLGYTMNVIVMAANHGMMPVALYNCGSIDFGKVHSCMTDATHLKWMADWINVGQGEQVVLASLGDALEYLVESTWIYSVILWMVLAIERHHALLQVDSPSQR